MNDSERDQLLARLDERSLAAANKLDELHADVQKQNGRVRKLESKANVAKGAIIVISTLLTLLATFFAGHIYLAAHTIK